MKPVSLIGYLAFGYPSFGDSIERARRFKRAGIDAIEVVIPARKPYLDNEYIQMTMRKALNVCSDYEQYFSNIEHLKDIYKTDSIMILVYSETIDAIGVKVFTAHMKQLGLSQLILVGKRSYEIKHILMPQGISVSSWVPFHMPDDAIEEALESNGFIYLQSKSTGKYKEGCLSLSDCVSYLRKQGINQPIYCGVGVSSSDDIKRIAKAGGEAAFIGSALLKLETQEDLTSFVSMMKEQE